MKIADVAAIPLAIPVRPSTPPTAWLGAIAKQILVRVRTDDGVTGWGEAFAYGAPLAVCNVIDEALAPMLVGQDPTRIEHLVNLMQRGVMIWGRRGLAMFALSGVELALWDLLGKARGVPVHVLIGGLCQPRIPAYASLPRYATASDVGRAATLMAERGYRAIKLHQTDIESVAVARDDVGDTVDLMLDTNCPWSVEEAIRIGRALERYGLRWLEEPVWPPDDYAGLARVRRAIDIPIAAGENDATMFGMKALMDAGAADIVQPSVTKVGGISEMQRIAVLAAAAGVTMIPHAFYFGPGLAATAHVASASPVIPFMEFPPFELEAPLVAEPLRCVDGHVGVSERPGLGADPDPAVLERFPYRREAARPFYLT
jgi:L-alanine-DL-glutamate epimerase-like enolase superfamily enzyme